MSAMKLTNPTIQVIMRNNEITKEQAEDLWEKSISFNSILITKYGDKYMENVSEVVRLTKKYQNQLVAKYKSK
jgi:hypothetical protein